MLTPLPATTAQEISDDLTRIIGGTLRYAKEETFELRALRSKIEKLMKVDAGSGWRYKAAHLTVLGKHDEAIAALTNALRLDSSPSTRGYLGAVVNLNLGDFDLALNNFLFAADPRTGYFSTYVEALIHSGGIRAAWQYCEIAARMGLKIPRLPIDLSLAIQALDTLDTPPMADADIAQLLTTAALVMREHELMISKPHLDIIQYDDGSFCYQFPLHASPAEVADITMEASMHLAALPRISSAVSVSFLRYAPAESEPLAA